jgi:hypothetical protein
MNMTEGIIYYAGKVRIGRLSMSKLCFFRMQEKGLTPELLKEAFRYGREIEEGRIVYAYENGIIGLFYAQDETRITRGNLNDERFILITCWKEVNK